MKISEVECFQKFTNQEPGTVTHPGFQHRTKAWTPVHRDNLLKGEELINKMHIRWWPVKNKKIKGLGSPGDATLEQLEFSDKISTQDPRL